MTIAIQPTQDTTTPPWLWPIRRAEEKEPGLACNRGISTLDYALTGAVNDPTQVNHRTPELLPGEKALLANDNYVVTRSRQAISDAVQARAALFFQQLIVCWNTPWHFEPGDRQEEHTSAESIKKTGDTARKPSVSFQAAHNATVPWLYAYPRREWENWEQKQGTKPSGFVYLKRSYFYDTHTSTNELITEANQVDTAVDGKNQQANGLRQHATQILNRAAKGEVTPEEGLALFLKAFAKRIESRLDEETNGRKLGVLKIYQRETRRVTIAAGSSKYLDQLLGVPLGQSAHENAARARVYRARYHLFTATCKAESAMMRHLHNLKAELQRGRSEVAGMDRAIQAKVLELAGPHEKQALIKLFRLGPDELNKPAYKPKKVRDVKLTESDRSPRPLQARGIIDQKYAATPARFQNLMRDLRAELRNIRREEAAYRATTFRILRNSRSWTQKELSTAYMDTYQKGGMSQSSVSRIENELKPLPRTLVEEVAALFEVESGLLMPAIFSTLA